MLEELLRLESAGKWSEIRERQAELIDAFEGEGLARAYLSLAKAYGLSATGGADWREALRYSRNALSAAPRGSFLEVWALQRLANCLVDMGRTAQAKPFVSVYMNLCQKHTESARLTPFVERAYGKILMAERRFFEAAQSERKAAYLFKTLGQDEQVARSLTIMVWRYAKAGRLDLARSIGLAEVPESLSYLVAGATAAMFAAEGNWQAAYDAGQVALRGARATYDFADAAEVCLILAKAGSRLNRVSDTFAYIGQAAKFAAQQDFSVHTLVVLNNGQEGGVTLHVHAAASLGSGGLHLDAAFTTTYG